MIKSKLTANSNLKAKVSPRDSPQPTSWMDGQKSQSSAAIVENLLSMLASKMTMLWKQATTQICCRSSCRQSPAWDLRTHKLPA